MPKEFIDCNKCINQGSNVCPLLKGESIENIARYQCSLFGALPKVEAHIQKSAALDALERIKNKEVLVDIEMTDTFYNDCDTSTREDFKFVEETLKRNIELEQRNLILTNLKTTSMINKKPLSNLFAGLSQEERYKYIEHIYYTYSEVKEELDCLKLIYQKVVSDSKAKDTKLNAFEIIKKKRVSTEYFIGVCKLFKKYRGKVLVWGHTYTSELEYYNHFLYERLIGDPPISPYKKRRYLTQEEFDSLKEELL